MQQLTVKQIFSSTLLRFCREATDKVRPKENGKPRKYSQEQVDKIHDLLKQRGLTSPHVALQAKIYAVLFDAPELNVPEMIPLEQFCVVVLDTSEGGHGYCIGEPIIVTDKSNRFCLHSTGEWNRWSFHVLDKPRLATDEEIEFCIAMLSDQQWNVIRTNSIFKPVMEAAMNQAVTVDGMDQNSDSKEVVLSNGRKITVDAE